MTEINTIREMFTHYDWATDLMLAATLPLSDEKLDQPFEMGWGTLRKTLWHIHGSEHTWLQRISGEPVTRFAPEGDHPPMAALQARSAETRARRYRLLEMFGQDDARLASIIHYSDSRSNQHDSRLGDILLHVCNHGTHHRAQAANMLRHLGVNPPKLDYIYLKLAQESVPRLSRRILRDYFDYTDWANGRIMDLVRQLTNEHLDRAFEMGLGSIRKTLVHLHEAERWWLENWKSRDKQPLRYSPTLADAASFDEICQHCERTATHRNEFVDSASDDVLECKIPIQTREGPREIAVGVTMLQLGGHGTHHRAQVINMLRHFGKTAPTTDYIAMKRQPPNQS